MNNEEFQLRILALLRQMQNDAAWWPHRFSSTTRDMFLALEKEVKDKKGN